mmetsp:Transcript_29294/g.43008  ORF Transcript_29294/g.43008 Transcript_29294/m.43008 type:complete len:239 (-) Transcript_29294:252-968(-)
MKRIRNQIGSADAARSSKRVTRSETRRVEQANLQRITSILPLEFIAETLSYLEFDDMARYGRVSKAWMSALSHIGSIHVDLDGKNGKQKLKFATLRFGFLTSISIDHQCDVERTRDERIDLTSHLDQLISSSLPHLKYFRFNEKLSVRNDGKKVGSRAFRALKDATQLEGLIIRGGLVFGRDEDLKNFIDIFRCKPKLKALALFNLFSSSNAWEKADFQLFCKLVRKMHSLKRIFVRK